MFQFVELSDGTTACELTDGINYALVSYAPQISTLRNSLLGGQGPYDTVVDSLTVHALGTTAAEAYANASALSRLIDTANRWWLDQNATPVILRAQVQDSTKAPLRAILYGPPPNAGRAVVLPPQWSEYFGKYVVQNLVVQCVRGGEWLHNTVDVAASANASHPTIHTCTFSTAAATQTPIDLSLSGATAADVFNYQEGFVLIGPTSSL